LWLYCSDAGHRQLFLIKTGTTLAQPLYRAALMKLKEFIEYRSCCPICDTVLDTTQLLFSKQTINKTEGDRFISIFTLKSLDNRLPDYKAAYSIGLEDNSLQVEFYSEWSNHHFAQVPMHLIEKFKNYYNNNSQTGLGYRFDKMCSYCRRYKISSNFFPILLKTCNIGEIKIRLEMFGLSLPKNDGYTNIVLANHYTQDDSFSKMRWWHVPEKDAARDTPRLDIPYPATTSDKKIPLLPFVSKEETARRLENLLMFV
jgi:hypothetical protein